MSVRVSNQGITSVIASSTLILTLGVSDNAQAQLLYDLNFDSSVATSTLIPDASGNGFDFDNTTEDAVPANFVYAANDLLLNPADQVLDVEATGNGGTSQDIGIFDEVDISDAGGFTFQTYIKRTSNTPGQAQNIWNPAGTHSLEITSLGELQLAIRGVAASLHDADTVLPLGEWHHVAGVFTVNNPIDPNAGPFDPLSKAPDGTYQLYIDGVLMDPDNAANPDDFAEGNLCGGGFIGSCIVDAGSVPGDSPADAIQRQKHGLGATNFGTPNFHFRGQIATNQLSLGVTAVNDFDIFRIEGDLDLDGDVDVDDVAILTANFGAVEDSVVGQRVTFANGDLNGDSVVDLLDYNILALNFGNTAVPPPASSATIPEPASLAVMAIGLAAMTRRS